MIRTVTPHNDSKTLMCHWCKVTADCELCINCILVKELIWNKYGKCPKVKIYYLNVYITIISKKEEPL